MNYQYGELVKILLNGKLTWVRYTGNKDEFRFMTEKDYQSHTKKNST